MTLHCKQRPHNEAEQQSNSAKAKQSNSVIPSRVGALLSLAQHTFGETTRLLWIELPVQSTNRKTYEAKQPIEMRQANH